jgi:hypothetical protein
MKKATHRRNKSSKECFLQKPPVQRKNRPRLNVNLRKTLEEEASFMDF